MKKTGVFPRHCFLRRNRFRAPGRQREARGRAPCQAVSPALLLSPFGFLGYIGAGTGSLIIQVVIASLVGGAFVIKIYWRRLADFFRRGGGSEEVGQ